MKKAMKLLLVVFCVILVMGAFPVSAAEPYQTYTYSSEGYALWSPPAYEPHQIVDSEYIGLYEDEDAIAFDEASDIEADEEGNIYLSDTKNHRIVIMDKFYKLKKTITTFENEYGSTDKLNTPRGLFVRDGELYVCDSENNRIVVFYTDGSYSRTIDKPTSSLFGDDSLYKPVAVAVDQYGQVFVVSSTTYQGVILMTQEGDFTGFIGAQKVVYNVFDIIWRRFMTEEQLKRQQQYMSTEFNNLTIDSDGFVYVTTSALDASEQMSAIQSKSADYSPVKKLNSAGDEIMKRNGFFDPGGEVAINIFGEKAKYSGPSTIVDVAVGEEGSWSIIDAKRNKVFTYDQNGNLLFAFGDDGQQLGNLLSLTAITYQGSHMILLDKMSDSFTVYRRTDYANRLIDALRYENNRDFKQAIEAWKDVLRHNNNFDAAYIGVGKALYRESQYEAAMKYFESAYDTDNYSDAYKEVRKVWIEQYIIFIPIVLIAIIVLWRLFKKFTKRVNYETSISTAKRTYVQELCYVFHLMYHPFDGFWDLKHEKRGSVRAASTVVALTILAFFYQSVGSGYLANPTKTYSTIFTQILLVCVPLLLWVVANWCLTTLFDGEGSLKDIYVACGYAIAPLPIMTVISTILTNVLTADEMAVATLLTAISFIWAGLLLFLGMSVTHDYSMGKNMITVIGTLLAMVVIMFVAVLFGTLIGKMISFVSALSVEISYRIG